MKIPVDPLKVYQEALAFYRKKDYGAALDRIDQLRKQVLRWPRLNLLEAYVYRDQGKYLSEIRLLRDFLQEFLNPTPEEREVVATGWSLLGSACYMLGQNRLAVDAFLRSSRIEPELGKKREECSNALFTASAIPDYSPEEYWALYETYRLLVKDIRPFPLRVYRHERLRIGYLSADFREHPLAYFLWAFLCGRDRSAFRLYGYSAGGSDDWMTQRIRGEMDVWRDISRSSDEVAARQIRQDEIDILFDFSGHTCNNRLPILAYHPATIQISGLGDVNSTGMEWVDYFWADRNCCRDRESARLYFSEKVVDRLRSSVCYTPLREMPTVPPAPWEHRGYITFGCFCNFSKVTDEMLSAWAEILQKVPNSRLILKHRLFGDEEGRAYARGRFRRIGLAPSRVELRNFSPNHLEEYGDIDIALDTYPYVGGITTCEALYMGVPVISRYGRRYGSRIGYNILKNAGVEELAANSSGGYIEKAVALAGDRILVTDLHRNLRNILQRSPLMDMEGYMREVEELYRSMWIKAWIARGRIFEERDEHGK